MAIVGAGLAGSFLALLLGRRGMEVDVFERLSFQDITGSNNLRSYNLTIYDYAIKVFEETNLWETLRPIMVQVKGTINKVGETQIIYPARTKCYTFQRADLLKAMIKTACQYPGVKFHFENSLLDIDKYNNKIIIREDKSPEVKSLSYEAVIGADGINSRVRMLLQLGQDSRHIQDYIDWSYKKFDLRPATSRKLNLKNGYIYTWTGKEGILVALPGDKGKYSAVLMLPKKGKYNFDKLNTPMIIRDYVTENVPDLLPIEKLIARSILVNQEGNMVTIQTRPWHYKNFLAIVGDAAHGLLPFSGQGVSAALTDGMLIDRLIDKYLPDWERIFSEYETVRREQTEVLADISRQSMGRYTRKNRVEPMIVFEKWERLINRIAPKYFQPPIKDLIDKDPNYAAEYQRQQKKQMILFKMLGGWIFAAAVTKAYGLLSMKSINSRYVTHWVSGKLHT